MQQKWTLHIEEFAKIKKAEIEIAPFLVSQLIIDTNSKIQ